MLAKVLFEVAVKLKEETGADIKFINLSGAGSFAPSAKTAAREAAACDMSRLTSDESFKQLIYCPAVFKQAAHTDGLPDSWKSLFESGIFRGIAGIPD